MNIDHKEAVSETIGIEEAAVMLRMSESALQRKAKAGKVPGAKIGREWVFVHEDLLALIRKQAKERECRSTNVQTARTGGCALAAKLASQLARRIAKPQKSTSASSRNASGGSKSSGTVVQFPGTRQPGAG